MLSLAAKHHEAELVRRRGLVLLLAASVHLHRVTHAHHLENARHALIALDLAKRLLRAHLVDLAVVSLLVDDAVQAKLLEDHLVLRERARLVREQVLHLTEILVEIARVRLGRLIRLLVVHLQVPLNETASR